MLYTYQGASYELGMSREESLTRPMNSMEIPSAGSTLQELLGISSHDISNPLQTVGVLLELLGDIVEPSHPAHLRVKQASEAGERMRILVKGLGDFVRNSPAHDRPREPRTVAYAVHQVLARRRERQRIEWSRDSHVQLALCAEIGGPLHLVITDFLLGALAETTHDPNSSYEILDTTDVGERHVTWRLHFVQTNGQERTSVPIGTVYRARIEAAAEYDLDFGIELADPATLLVRLAMTKEDF